jgi:UDP-glucose:(heptosyl)LPS alpha-1,3-glucosyltransferase
MTVKKIAIIRGSYSPYGGAETLTAALLHNMLESDVDVSLLTLPHQPWNISHPNLHIIPLGSPVRERLWQLWRFEQSVCNYLENNSFDCVFAIDRVSCFTHFHAGGGSHKTFLRIKNQNSNRISRLFRKISLFHASMLYIEKKGYSNPKLKKIHCCSQMVANDLCNDYPIEPNKCQIIFIGINWKEMGAVFENRAAVASELIKSHALNPERSYLLFLGSGYSRKGLDIAIEGLSGLPDSYHLIVVGKDNERGYLYQSEKLRVRHRVHFFGAKKEGWRYAALCKGFILPSRYEPFGLAAAEAQAMGIPVLVSENTGYAELVLPGKNGIILKNPVNRDNIRQAFTELKELIEKPHMSPEQIRENISHLDNHLVFQKIREFLEI